MNSMFAIVSARPPRHRHAVARRDVGICRIEIDLSATAGREDESIGPDRFHFARSFVEHINAETTIFGRKAELARGNQIDRHVILEQLHLGIAVQFAQQRLLNLHAGHVLHMQNAPFRMAAFASQIRLAMASDLPLVEVQTELDQFSHPRRPFHDDRAHRRFVAKPRARFERVRDMKLERIFIAGHARDAALRPGRVRISAFAFGNHRDRAVLRRLQGKRQPGDAAADDDEIVWFHSAVVTALVSRQIAAFTAKDNAPTELGGYS